MPLITPQDLLKFLVKSAQRNMSRDGELHTTVVGYDSLGRFTCAVQHSPESELDFTTTTVDGARTLLIPDPFQAHTAAITKWFEVNRVAWAALIGESWLFPQDEEGVSAAHAFIAGHGPSPSQYPRRVEGAFIALVAPNEMFLRVEMFSIERRPHRTPRLVSSPELYEHARNFTDSGSTVTPEGDVSWVSTWLEECLPQPNNH